MFRDRLRFLLRVVATRLIRRFRPPPDPSIELRRRIRSRIRRLGRVYVDGNSDLLGYTYHPVPFAEFGDVPAHRSACEERLRAILDAMPIRPGDWILDVGANVGFFAFGLAGKGAIVEAYEADSDTFEIGAALAKLHRADVLYINKPIAPDTLKYLRPRYRGVLLLSVFHWIMKQVGEDAAREVLRDLVARADHTFFEAPVNAADAMYRHPWFASREACKTFLRTTLPAGTPIVPLATDVGWMDRVLYRIDGPRESAR